MNHFSKLCFLRRKANTPKRLGSFVFNSFIFVLLYPTYSFKESLGELGDIFIGLNPQSFVVLVFGELSLRDKEETHVNRRQRCKGLRFGLYKFVKGMGRIRPV